MFIKVTFHLYLTYLTLESASEFGCYWNNACSFQLFGSKTPYDTVRGDLRDHPKSQRCEAVSLWSLHRHGNRNPGSSVTASMKVIAQLKNDIIAAYDAGRSQLCATDIDKLRKWRWNSTLETSASYLTGVGYEELYDIASRIRITYPELFNGTVDDYYFRTTDEQRTVTSATAFVHGLSEGTNLTLVPDETREVDNIIRPYKLCNRSQELVKEGLAGIREVESYDNSDDYNAVKAAVQQRLGIFYQLTTKDVYSIYEMCRFYRSWSPRLQDPWCAVFSDDDLVVLDYRDDVRHYYRNGYGSWVNAKLGEQPMKDLYENFEAAVQGRGRKITSYFTHDTMMEMVYCALGLYKDPKPLTGLKWDEDRLWRSSHMAAKAINLIAVLNRCEKPSNQAYRVQIFIGEKPTELCPLKGCTWEQFQQKFKPYTSTNLDFCSLDYPDPEPVVTETTELTDPASGSAFSHGLSWILLVLIALSFWRY